MVKKFFLLALMILLISCGDKTEQTVDAESSNNKVTVNEVIQANSYTYLNVNDGEKDFWMAVAKGDFKEDQTLYYDQALEMKNFKSKDLDRTFDSVYFIQNISSEPNLNNKPKMGMAPQGKKPEIEKVEINLDKLSDGVTIAELFEQKDELVGKTIKIKGKVTKVNPQIMGRNWVHIQDGTEFNGQYDLTLTSDEQPNVGDVVILEGVVAVDKDFGAGYFYELIVEDSKIIN